jgi:hypothetical protein
LRYEDYAIGADQFLENEKHRKDSTPGPMDISLGAIFSVMQAIHLRH